MEHLGDEFGLVVFDECHHLPGPAYALAARACARAVPAGADRDARARRRPRRGSRRAGRADRLPQGHRRAVGRLPGAVRDRAADGGPGPGGAARPRRGARRLPRLPRPQRHPHVQPDRLVRLHHPLRAQRRRPARDGRVPAAARDRVRGAGQAGLRRPAAGAPRARPHAAVHAGQRDRVRDLAAVPAADHHARDERARAQRDPGRARRGQLRRRRHVEGAERRRRHPGGERRGRRVRAARRCASTCSGWGASCARATASARCSTSWSPRGRPRPSPASGGGTTVLTADLVGVRRRGDELRLVPVDDRRRAHIEALAAALASVAREHVGKTRDELDDALDGAARGTEAASWRRRRPAADERRAQAGARRLPLRRDRPRAGAGAAPRRVPARRRREARGDGDRPVRSRRRCWPRSAANAASAPPTSRRACTPTARRASACSRSRAARPRRWRRASRCRRRRPCCCARPR